MTTRVAIVTGGLRGLGRSMALGLAEAGHRLVAGGHRSEDEAPYRAEAEPLRAPVSLAHCRVFERRAVPDHGTGGMTCGRLKSPAREAISQAGYASLSYRLT